MNDQETRTTVVLEEDGVRVTISDDGELHKPWKNEPNPSRQRMTCMGNKDGCPGTTTARSAICGRCRGKGATHLHAKDYLARREPSAGSSKGMHGTLAKRVYGAHSPGHERLRLQGFVLALVEEFQGNVPDATRLHEAGTGAGPGTLTHVGGRVRGLLDAWYPHPIFAGLDESRPNRVMMAEFAALVVCEEINRGDEWARKKGLVRERTSQGLYMALSGLYQRLSGVPSEYLSSKDWR